MIVTQRQSPGSACPYLPDSHPNLGLLNLANVLSWREAYGWASDYWDWMAIRMATPLDLEMETPPNLGLVIPGRQGACCARIRVRPADMIAFCHMPTASLTPKLGLVVLESRKDLASSLPMRFACSSITHDSNGRPLPTCAAGTALLHRSLLPRLKRQRMPPQIGVRSADSMTTWYQHSG